MSKMVNMVNNFHPKTHNFIKFGFSKLVQISHASDKYIFEELQIHVVFSTCNVSTSNGNIKELEYKF